MIPAPLLPGGDILAARRPVFFHAHPDDETLSTGGLMALAARRGAHVALVTATRGERGDVVPGPLSALAGTAELEEYRAGELRGALAALGGGNAIAHCYLGEPPARAGQAPTRYRDSGMVWGDDGVPHAVTDAPPDALTRADLNAQVHDLVAALRHFDADLVVSYGPQGGYGHPDHVRCARIAQRAAGQAGVAYLAALSDSELAGLTDAQRLRVITVDATGVTGAVEAALGAHASQLTVLAPDGAPKPAISLQHCGGQLEERRMIEYYLPADARPA